MKIKVTTQMSRTLARDAVVRAGADYEPSEQEVDVIVERSRSKVLVPVSALADFVKQTFDDGYVVSKTEEP